MLRPSDRNFEPPKPSQDRWLISYADFVTLLLAFFVTMYAFTRLDSEKLVEAQYSIQQALHAQFPPLTPGLSPQLEGLPFKTAPLPPENLAGRPDDMETLRSQQQLRETSKEFEQLLQHRTDKKDFQVFFTPEGMVVRFRDLLFFDSAKATLRPEVYPLLDEVAAILKKIPNEVMIEGHTDNRPIHTTLFPSNWELSAARAIVLVRYFIETSQLAPTRFSAAGYGEFRPIADNLTDPGQQSNRRVDIIIRPLKPKKNTVQGIIPPPLVPPHSDPTF
jgi:chemotaxis protein MotB